MDQVDSIEGRISSLTRLENGVAFSDLQKLTSSKNYSSWRRNILAILEQFVGSGLRLYLENGDMSDSGYSDEDKKRIQTYLDLAGIQFIYRSVDSSILSIMRDLLGKYESAHSLFMLLYEWYGKVSALERVIYLKECLSKPPTLTSIQDLNDFTETFAVASKECSNAVLLGALFLARLPLESAKEIILMAHLRGIPDDELDLGNIKMIASRDIHEIYDKSQHQKSRKNRQK